MGEEVPEETVAGEEAKEITVEQNGTELTEIENKIIYQIEFYFGDINLSRDKFLQEKIKEEDGWVTLETMLAFNRLSLLSKDQEFIATALAKSKTGLMEISEDKKKIRRSPNKPVIEMNEERRKELMTRTVYCRGFPLKDTNMNKLLEFFLPFGKIEHVVMRNYQDKAAQSWNFKGSVFVIFSTIEEADAFLKLESVKYGETELVKLWQSEYIEKKRQERLEDKLKKKKSKNNEEEGDEEEEEGLPTGTVVQFSGIEGELVREVIKEKVESLGFPVAFIDFQKGDKEGFLRLELENSAKEFIQKLESEGGKLKVKEDEIVVKALEGEEEATYLKKAKSDMLKRRNQAKNNRRRGRGGGRGGRGGYARKRRGSPNRGDGPTPAKVKSG